jgi:hypothetical protein
MADRETAQNALKVVMTFLLDHGIESSPVARLLSALSALSAGSSLPNIFKPLPASNRRPDSPEIEGIKCRLAGIVEYLQRSGKSRRAATQWGVQLLSQTTAPLAAHIERSLIEDGFNKTVLLVTGGPATPGKSKRLCCGGAARPGVPPTGAPKVE